jgi:murein DD-endopeptidase MepM/ murein hydrolase activator NlpD
LAPQGSTPSAGSQAGLEVDELAARSPGDSTHDLAFCADWGDNADGGPDVLQAPELDDLTDTDDLGALRLEPRPDLDAAVIDAVTGVLARAGKHHRQGASATRGRVLIAAMAVGGVAAAAYSVTSGSPALSTKTVLASGSAAIAGGPFAVPVRGMQLVTANQSPSDTHSEEFARGTAFAEERAEREARLQRPLFVKPTNGIFTSGYGYRWGALHAGIDLANAIGTPIYAVADGIVIDAGPTAGYGAWVKLRHADGTVTLYGHVNSWLVNVGQRVMAGDQIATIGNRGNSTGPHCHFEVMPDGVTRIDPVPWLAQRGINVGAYTG